MKYNKVLTDIQQNLTETEKTRARTNIDAVAEGKFAVGNGAPTTTPTDSNFYYFDNTNGDLYVSKGEHDFTWKKIGGGSSDTFFAEYEETTYADIKAAVEAGKAVFMKNNDGIFALRSFDDGIGQIMFTTISGPASLVAWLVKDGTTETWSIDVLQLARLSDIDAKFTVGSGAPSAKPTAENLYYFDKTNGELYISKGTSSASDWSKIGGGSGDSEVFFAKVNTTSYADVKAAYDAGKKVFAIDVNNGICCLSVFSSPLQQFTFSCVGDARVYQYTLKSSGWSPSSSYFAVTITVNSSTAVADYTKVMNMMVSGTNAVFAIDMNDYDTVWRALWKDSKSIHFGCFEFDEGVPKMFFRELKSTGWTAEQECLLTEYKDVEPIVNRLENFDTCSIRMYTDEVHTDYEVKNFHGAVPPVIIGYDSDDYNAYDVSWMLHWSEVENQSGDRENGPWSVNAVYVSPDRMRMVQISFNAEYNDDGELSISSWTQDFRSLRGTRNPPSYRPPCAGLVAYGDSIWMTNESGEWIEIGA